MPRSKLALYVSVILVTVLTGSLAAYAFDFEVFPTDTLDLLDFAANNVKSASDTVQIMDNSSPSQSLSDSLPLLDSTSSNSQIVADIVDFLDSTFSNGQTTTDTVVITDSTGRDTSARDEVVFSDSALPDSAALDMVTLSDSPLVESFIFHPVFASDTVDIVDDISPDSMVLDIVSVSDDSLAEAFIFHALFASDTVTIGDTASLFSAVLDTIAIADTGSLFNSVLDSVSISDNPLVESFIFYGIFANDVVDVVDVSSIFSAVLDIVGIDENPSVQSNTFYGIVASDIVSINDATSLFVAAIDTFSIVDTASLFSSVIDAVSLDDIAAIQANIFYGITANDNVVLSDLTSLFSAAADVLELSDSAAVQSNLFYALVANDIVSIVDAATTFSSVIDVVAITEVTSLPIASVIDVVDIVIAPSLTIVKSLIEQMAVGDSFFDIAVAFSKIFNETLLLPDCVFTNESGQCGTVGIVTIIIGDALQLVLGSVNNPAEQLAAQDQFARSYTGGRGDSESLQTRDSESMMVTSPPPSPPPAIAVMPAIIMTQTDTMGEIDGLADPSEAVEVTGTWSMSGLDNENLESLLVAMGMPIYNVSTMAGSDGIEEMTMVLPTFELSIDDVPNGGVFVTPTVSDMPAGLQVMAPIDVKESMGESLGPLGNMTVSFTPAAAGNNVTMMIALLDDNPEQDLTSEWPDGVPAFYIDLSFAGDFAGPDLSDEAFYDDGPLLTFTLDTDWARENDLRLPKVNLFLLDEATGEWEELRITGLPQSPVNGIYTYTAELPHMSTYAVTADRLLQGEDSDEYDVSLSESLFVTGSVVQGPAEGGRTIIRDLVESVEIGIGTPETQHQRVITFQNFTVGVSVTDIRSSDQFGTAVVLLKFEIVNAGGSPEELAIKYWYVDSGGTTAYEDALTMTVGSSEYVVREVQVPFKSAGVYSIMVEAVAQDQTLAATDITIEVPWLAANLYLLAIIITAVVAVSIGFVAYAMRSQLQK